MRFTDRVHVKLCQTMSSMVTGNTRCRHLFTDLKTRKNRGYMAKPADCRHEYWAFKNTPGGIFGAKKGIFAACGQGCTAPPCAQHADCPQRAAVRNANQRLVRCGNLQLSAASESRRSCAVVVRRGFGLCAESGLSTNLLQPFSLFALPLSLRKQKPPPALQTTVSDQNVFQSG